MRQFYAVLYAGGRWGGGQYRKNIYDGPSLHERKWLMWDKHTENFILIDKTDVDRVLAFGT